MSLYGFVYTNFSVALGIDEVTLLYRIVPFENEYSLNS